MAFNTGITYDGPLAAGDVGTPNQGDSMYLQFGAIGSRMAAGNRGVQYFATDEGKLYYDNGSSWVEAGTAWNKIIRKPASESVTSSTTLQNDDDFVLAVAANEKWTIRLRLQVQGMSSGGNFKFTFTLPTGANGQVFGFVLDTLATTPTFLKGYVGETPTNTHAITGWAGDGVLELVLDFENGANAGNVQLQWAQNTSNGTPVTVVEGSHMVARRIA